jgi:hypothetical protein
LAGIIIFRAGCACTANATTDAAKTTKALRDHLRIGPPLTDGQAGVARKQFKAFKPFKSFKTRRRTVEIFANLKSEFFKYIVKAWLFHKLHDRRFFFTGRAGEPSNCFTARPPL